MLQFPGVDCSCQKWDMISVKNSKPAPEPKTPGTMAVEKHRPLLNKLTEAQRRRLRQRAAALLYGHEATAPGR
jgi:Mlc titration factor MtfA (ptsG expression regulator)